MNTKTQHPERILKKKKSCPKKMLLSLRKNLLTRTRSRKTVIRWRAEWGLKKKKKEVLKNHRQN